MDPDRHVIIENVEGSSAFVWADGGLSDWIPLSMLSESPAMTPIGISLPVLYGDPFFVPGTAVVICDWNGAPTNFGKGETIGKRTNRVEPEYAVHLNDSELSEVIWVTASLLVEEEALADPHAFSASVEPKSEIRVFEPSGELSTPVVGLVVLTLFVVVWSLD